MDEILDHEREVKEKLKRPVIITILCVWEFVSLCITIIYVYNLAQIRSFFTVDVSYNMISAVVTFGISIGLWYMKRWAGIAYITCLIISYLVGVYLGMWSVVRLCIVIGQATFVWFEFKKLK